uniref:R3H domain-containing protein n=1 Tax=Arion vulgaris TaxID=1028688 RepID=A0A0B7B4I0_9EUPU
MTELQVTAEDRKTLHELAEGICLNLGLKRHKRERERKRCVNINYLKCLELWSWSVLFKV